jgi:hypothetical protein
VPGGGDDGAGVGLVAGNDGAGLDDIGPVGGETGGCPNGDGV